MNPFMHSGHQMTMSLSLIKMMAREKWMINHSHMMNHEMYHQINSHAPDTDLTDGIHNLMEKVHPMLKVRL